MMDLAQNHEKRTNGGGAKRIIYCDGGLGNRLNAILPALALTADKQLAVEIWWPRTPACDCEFSDLFESDIPVFSNRLDDLESKRLFQAPGFIALTHIRIPTIEADKSIHHSSLTTREQYESLWVESTFPILYNHCLIPRHFTFQYLASAFRKIRIKDSVRSIVATFVADHDVNPSRTIGLHLRGTDFFTDQKIVKKYEGLLECNADKKFYICSDEKTFEEAYQKYSNSIFRKKVEYPELRLPKAGEQITNHLVYRGAAAVVEGLIDMLVLSHTNPITTSKSTFLTMAKLMGAARQIDKTLV